MRPEVKEQIQSLGAQFIEFDLGESGAGSGGYAKALSPEAQKNSNSFSKRVCNPDGLAGGPAERSLT